MYLTDIYATRRTNLSRLVESKRYASTQKDFAQRIGKAAAQVNQWLTKRRNIGEGTRDDIEDTLGLPRGWLDVDRSGAPAELDLPTAPPVPDLTQALPVVLTAIANLSPMQWSMVRGALDQLHTHPEMHGDAVDQLLPTLQAAATATAVPEARVANATRR